MEYHGNQGSPLTQMGNLGKHVRKNIYLYIMLFPVLLWFAIFHYLPMGGILMAFEDFSYAKGYLRSPFVGLKHFHYLFTDSFFLDAFRNTWIINGYRVLFGWSVPIVFALLLNEVRHSGYKRLVQTITYLPHFISWVVLSGIMVSLLAKNYGSLNQILALLGFERVDFLLSSTWIRTVIIASDVWKEAGWNTIIYLAAISAINPELYEAAHVDGAGRFSQIWYITLPQILNTMMVILIIFVGRILMVGFEQIYNLYTPLTYGDIDIIDTYIVRYLQTMPVYGRLAAAGIVKSLLGLVLLAAANRTVKFFGREGIY
jgi:putative aldouronate transport system permease protein